ncbi:MAG: NAD(P)/FAD-dependent oxidoreductase [Pontibacterium sp.]
MNKAHLVIIGNGMASSRLLRETLALDTKRYHITVFDQEPHGSYNRIMLSPVLADEIAADEILINPAHWYEQQGINLHTNDPVTAINRLNKTVTSKQGLTVAYDKLVIATGSQPTVPPVAKTCTLEGVLSFRNLRDVAQIKEQSVKSDRALVIGGGLLGLEAAYGLSRQGAKVTVLHRADWLLNRQLDKTAGTLLKQTLENKGIEIKLGVEATEFIGDKKIETAALSDGTVLAVQQVVIAIGITPNTALAENAGLNYERGILVNHKLQTCDPDIYALGECCQFGQETFGLVAPIWDQTRVLANQLCANGQSSYQVNPTATKLKVSGIDLYSAGEYLNRDDTEANIFYDRSQGTYKKLLFRRNKLVGAVLYGAVQDGNWYFDLIQQQTDTRSLRPHIIFGRDFTEQKTQQNLATAAITPTTATASN